MGIESSVDPEIRTMPARPRTTTRQVSGTGVR